MFVCDRIDDGDKAFADTCDFLPVNAVVCFNQEIVNTNYKIRFCILSSLEGIERSWKVFRVDEEEHLKRDLDQSERRGSEEGFRPEPKDYGIMIRV